MGKLSETVEELLKQDRWMYQARCEAGDGVSFESRIQGYNAVFDFVLAVHEDISLLSVTCLHPFEVPPAMRGAVAEYIARVNFHSTVAAYEMNMETGDIGVRSRIWLDDSQLSTAMLDVLIQAPANVADEFYPGLIGVVFACRDPREAFEACLKESAQD